MPSSKPTPIVCGIIFDKNKKRVLIAQRGPRSKFRGQWEFPGGKIERGETPKEALVREIREELNLEIKHCRQFMITEFNYGARGNFQIFAYVCKIAGGKLKIRVHSRTKWVPIRKLRNYRFIAADLAIIERLISQYC